MTKQRHSRADLQEKKIKVLIEVVQKLLNAQEHLKDLAVGTLETMRMLPGTVNVDGTEISIYEAAFKKLKENNLKQEEHEHDIIK